MTTIEKTKAPNATNRTRASTGALHNACAVTGLASVRVAPGADNGGGQPRTIWDTSGAADRGYARQSSCTAACTGKRCGVAV